MHLPNRYIILCALSACCTQVTAQKSFFQYDPYFNIPVLKPGESPGQKFNSLIFLRVVTNKPSVYTGEAFLAEYKLYRAVNSNPSPGKQPTFTGCSVVELSPLNNAEAETVDGKQYHVALLRKVQLTALREGPLVLDEASVNNTVEFAAADNPNLVKTIDFEAVSKPLTIDVKPLPDKGKPVGFTGLAGNFGISIKADSNKVPAGENSHLTLTIKGAGDIAAVTLPDIKWPANTEHFEPSVNQRLVHEDFPSGGEKTFDIPFIGAKEGTATIPPVYFTFFNTKTGQYDSVHTDSLSIHFTKTRQKETLHEIITEDITSQKYIWIVPALALVVAFILIMTGKTQRREKNKQRRKAEEENKPLPLTLPPPEKTDFAAEINSLQAVENDHVFFTRAKELLTQALRQKLNSFAFYEADILQELQLKSHNKVLAETAHEIYKICNQNLYSPIINKEQRSTLQAALTEVIKQLEV